jgi:hypothetical protein
MDVKLITMLLAVIALIATIYFVAKVDPDSNENLENLEDNLSDSDIESYSDSEQLENFASVESNPQALDQPSQKIVSSDNTHKEILDSRNNRLNQAPNMVVSENAVTPSIDAGPSSGNTAVTNWDGRRTNNEDGSDEVLNTDGTTTDDGVENPFNEENQNAVDQATAVFNYNAREEEYKKMRDRLNNPDQVAQDNEVLTLPGTDALSASSKGFYAVSSISTAHKNPSTDLRGEPNVKHDSNFFAPFNSSSWKEDNLVSKVSNQNWCQ